MANKKGASVTFNADVKDFNASIKKANNEIKLMNAELKLSSKEMTRNGESVDSLEKHQKLLQQQLDASEDKTEALNQKIAKAIEYYGENSTEVNNLKIQLANAKTEQEKMKISLESCNEKLEKQRAIESELNSETKKLTDTISEQESKLSKLKQEYVEASIKYGDTSDEAKKLGKEIQDLSGELNENKTKFSQASDKADALDKSLDKVEESADDARDGFTVMKGAMSELVADGVSSLISGCGDLLSSFSDLSEETQEYREDINKLKTAWESANLSTELATKTYKDFYSVLGEEDRSIEAINHLAKFVDTEQDMAKWTEICTGVWGTFGDSLPIEGLTEASNETVKTGQVTGVLADALNWAAKSGETFGVKLKKNTKANEEWNKAVQACTKAEDYFNLALQECTTEQERQALICNTLNGLYSDASKNYKENNKSIIASRKATSEYNDVLAEMGEELEPVNTKVTKLKTTFLKELSPTLKKQVVPAFEDFIDELEDSGAIEGFADTVGDLAEGVLPVLANGLEFVAENFIGIANAIGITVFAFQTMSIISTVTTAIQGATTAMGVFNAILSANPIGAVVTSVGLLVGGMALLYESQENSHEKAFEEIESFTALTETEQELIDKTLETGQAFGELRDSIDETNTKIVGEMTHTKGLADELFKLTDANGKVEEANRTRAQFILNELNEALGTEYSMVDGIIQNYKTLETSIYDVINAKTADALLETKNEEYLLAIQNEQETLAAVSKAYDDWQAQIQETNRVKEESNTKIDELNKIKEELVRNHSEFLAGEYAKEIQKEREKIQVAEESLGKKKKVYDDEVQNYAIYQNTITEYENAAMLIQKGNYDEAVNMLKNKGDAFFEYSDNVSQATRDAVDSLYYEAVQAGIKAGLTKRNFENGVDGYTKKMVSEAEQGYEDALDKWANAYTDANGVGKDLGDGLNDGMTSKQGSLFSKARSIVSGIISEMRKAADSHSPARKTIDFGEDMGEGTEIGLDNKTDDIIKSAEKQVGGILGAYESVLSKPMAHTVGFGDIPVLRNVTSTIEHTINKGSLVSLVSAIERLASRKIEIGIGDRLVAEATARANDEVNGLRNELIERGLILG